MGVPEKTVLAIDPGSGKCGLALLRRLESGELTILWRAVVPQVELEESLAQAVAEASFSTAILGSGTCSRQIAERLRQAMPSLGILLVDEKDTSLEARARYWEHHPRRGWRRFWPAALQVPPEPVDDFVAVILAERVLNET